jgi:hypothetical protein
MMCSVGEVGPGEGDPARFDVHADRVAASVDGFDQTGPGPGERVQDQIAGTAVTVDQSGSEVGGHPVGVSGTADDVPAVPLRCEGPAQRWHRRPAAFRVGSMS